MVYHYYNINIYNLSWSGYNKSPKHLLNTNNVTMTWSDDQMVRLWLWDLVTSQTVIMEDTSTCNQGSLNQTDLRINEASNWGAGELGSWGAASFILRENLIFLFSDKGRVLAQLSNMMTMSYIIYVHDIWLNL